MKQITGKKEGGCCLCDGDASVCWRCVKEMLDAVATEVVMTPQHPRWKEFYKILEGPECCNFHKDESGKFKWRCKGGHDQTFAKAILMEMDDIDVEASLAYFRFNGGHCDCEILFNVDAKEVENE